MDEGLRHQLLPAVVVFRYSKVPPVSDPWASLPLVDRMTGKGGSQVREGGGNSAHGHTPKTCRGILLRGRPPLAEDVKYPPLRLVPHPVHYHYPLVGFYENNWVVWLPHFHVAHGHIMQWVDGSLFNQPI